MHVWNVLHAARWNKGRKKSPSRHYRTTLSGYISSQLRHWQSEKMLNINTSSICPHNMVNLGPITAENCWRVRGTPANFNGFRVSAALLHGTPAVSVSQTLRRWTEGAMYIRQGSHHVRHWPTFLVLFYSPNLSRRRLDVYHTSTDTWCGPSANLECRSDTYCTRLSENTGRKNRHLATVAQVCRAISSQLRHVSTIGKIC